MVHLSVQRSPKTRHTPGQQATLTNTGWSQRVIETSHALDLKAGVFTLDDPRQIARSLKRSAESCRQRKTDPFRSAMSMLNFYINRAGRQLPAARRARLEAAKDELRQLYGKPRRAAARRKS